MGIREFFPEPYFFTPEEIRRLKQYVRDSVYYFYIENRDKIAAAVDAAFEALDIARAAKSIAETAYSLAEKAFDRSRDALNIAEYAKTIASKAKELADQAYSRASEALNKAYEASNLVNELQNRVVKLKESVNNAWRQINSLTTRVEALRDFAEDLIERFKKAKERIEKIWAKFADSVSTHSNEIIAVMRRIGSPTARGTILYKIKTAVDEFLKVLGWAIVDYRKLDGKSSFWAYNKGEGIIADVADCFWCLGQCFYHLGGLVEKYHIGFKILGREYGFDIHVPNPAKLKDAIHWIWVMIQHPASRLFRKIPALGSAFNKIMMHLQELQSAVCEILKHTQEIVEDIANFAKEIANALVEIVGGTIKPTLSINKAYAIPAAKGTVPGGHSVGGAKPVRVRLRKSILLTFDDTRGFLKEIREIDLATRTTTAVASPRIARITPM